MKRSLPASSSSSASSSSFDGLKKRPRFDEDGDEEARRAAKIAARRAKLNAWKAKKAAEKVAVAQQATVSEALASAVRKAETLKAEQDEVDPLEAFMKQNDAVAKREIGKAVEKAKSEDKIVAEGGTIIADHSGEKTLEEVINANKRCYVCKQYGHTKADCPRKRCKFCGEIGHEHKFCEKWKRHLEDLKEQERKKKRKAQYARKKAKKYMEWTHKLRCETGIHGYAALYKTLQLDRRKLASRKEIIDAYRRLSKVWHPDKWATKTERERDTAQEKFLEIKSAYDLLLEGMEKGTVEGSGAVFSAGNLNNK